MYFRYVEIRILVMLCLHPHLLLFQLLKQCLLIKFEDRTSIIFNFTYGDKHQFLESLEVKQAEKADKQSLLKLNKVLFYTQRFNYSCSASL